MKYILKLEKENGEDCNEWVINTEYDFDLEDLDASMPCDDYIVREEVERLGFDRSGKGIGREIVMQIAHEENWDIDPEGNWNRIKR